MATTDGATATVQPSTATSMSAVALLEQATSCTLAPETQGPYYFDVDSVRSDIREDGEGTAFRLALRVRGASDGCAPISNAVVSLWHCDALGVYSGFESASQGADGGGEAPTAGPSGPGAEQGGAPPPAEGGNGGEATPTDDETYCAARRSPTATATWRSSPSTRAGTRVGGARPPQGVPDLVIEQA